MQQRRIARACALASVLAALFTAGAAGEAVAGSFVVASCQADRQNFSTQAFADFATRGMTIKRACNPEGPGLRGLITRNAVRAGRVPRGSVAMVTLSAPEGTSFTRLRWAGTLRRRDCRYAVQLYAEGAGIKTKTLRSMQPNRDCGDGMSSSGEGRKPQVQGYLPRTFKVPGATRIVQRVICVGGLGRDSCSARTANYILTDMAQAEVVDARPPSVSVIGDTALARGEWVARTQPLDYDASDNVGVREAQAIASGTRGGFHERGCAFSTNGAFSLGVPCPNGPGTINVETTSLSEGTQALEVQAQDSGGTWASSPPITVRVDNSAPARVDVSAVGGDAWKNVNDFSVAWVNPQEGDRAPITSATYTLCAVAGGSCGRGQQTGVDIAGFGVRVPAPGEFELSVVRGDAAGNASEAAASVPVRLRYDPEPPQLAFESVSAADPTLLAVQVSDRVSGVADGAIEIGRAGSDSWQALGTQREGNRLLARIDDAGLPAGEYVLRATARDHANNLGATTLRLDGQPMALTLPLRAATALQAGIASERVVRRTIRRHGKRQRVRRRETVLRPSARVAFGRQVQVSGRLVRSDGQGVAGAEIQLLARSAAAGEQLEAVVRADGEGRFSYQAAGSASRALRLLYAGSPTTLPAQGEVRLRVPAASSLRVSRRRVLNGDKVTFRGRVRTLPVPAGGKLIELQVRLSRRWQTFRTVRSDANGHWSIPYKFKRTRGVERYRLRVRLPQEANYPFETGRSPSVRVRVRGP